MSFLLFASSGKHGLIMSGEDCLLHFPWWKIHLGDVVTNVLCIQALYQILRRKKVQVVPDL